MTLVVFVSFVLNLHPAPAWVPAFAGMSGWLGAARQRPALTSGGALLKSAKRYEARIFEQARVLTGAVRAAFKSS